MKRVAVVFGLITLQATASRMFADLPGGYNQYSAYVYVYNHESDPEPGVEVCLQVITWYGDELNPDLYYSSDFSTTDSYGFAYLECLVPPEYSEGLYLMTAYMDDPDYTLLSSENTSTGTWATISPEFHVVYDTDGDSLDDNLESQLAEKFKPVLHKHSLEKQQDLSNVDWVLTGKVSLRGYNILGQTVYNSSISDPSDIHVYLGTGDRDSFGEGESWTEWRLNLDDTYRYQGAPVGQRPLYYHVYKEGDYYFVQYWFFFNMNDVQDQTNNDTWHEGDFEHISIKVDSLNDPVAINFYRHEGGRTVSPSECWWSSSNNLTYSGIAQGYSSTRTHIHVWIAANAHASYNRYREVYHITATGPDQFCWNLEDEDYIDNVDYDPSNYDLYFQYDYLEKLGEIKTSTNAHGYTWFSHYDPLKTSSKHWLCFVGRFGEHWAEVCFGQPAGTNSPLSPVFDLSGKPSHEWKSFTENYSIDGFGNPESSSIFANVNIEFTTDPTNGD